MTFGSMLRQWRTTRRMSQLALATESGISARHLSFLETGRAQPSREMVQLLAGMLDLPLAERNALLLGAGFAPAYAQRPLASSEFEHVRRALQSMMRQQEPFPALVMDGEWNIVMRNDASNRIFELFRGPVGADTTINAVHTVFDPKGLRPFIANWDELADCMMLSIHRDIALTGSQDLVRLREELFAYPDIPARLRTISALAADPPLVNIVLRKGDLTMTFFTTVTMFGRARDITLQDLKIECFFPADAATEQISRRLAIPDAVAV